jgi:hypothetical protein
VAPSSDDSEQEKKTISMEKAAYFGALFFACLGDGLTSFQHAPQAV